MGIDLVTGVLYGLAGIGASALLNSVLSTIFSHPQTTTPSTNPMDVMLGYLMQLQMMPMMFQMMAQMFAPKKSGFDLSGILEIVIPIILVFIVLGLLKKKSVL